MKIYPFAYYNIQFCSTNKMLLEKKETGSKRYTTILGCFERTEQKKL